MNEILQNYEKIAFYLRLSIADGDMIKGDKEESNSIENQRLLLREYVSRLIEKSVDEEYDDSYLELLTNAYLQGISEYVDDGYSGTNFDRPAFKKMIEDAKRKQINTILVKDTSRLGRDYIEVGDYMEQIFPLLGIRLIAVNSAYDSQRYENTTMGLETSLMNLVNAEYSKDLSRKIKSSRRTMWANGISTGGQAPFGYIAENKKYLIDPETAPIVRMIFEKAMDGWNTRAIASHLNEQHIPPPGKFIQKRTGRQLPTRVVSDDEWLWDTRLIYRVLKNYSYTGSMVHGKTKSLSVGSRKVRSTPKSEQYIIENSHEGIVTVDEWKLAQLAIRAMKTKSPKMSSGYVLLGKMRCGTCGLAMDYSEKGTPVVFCSHSINTGKNSKCCRTRHDAKKIESIVAGELGRQMRLLEYLGVKIEEKRQNCPEYIDICNIRRKTKSQLEILKAEKVRQYEAYAEGIIKREEYLRKKDEIAYKIENLTENLQKAEAVVAEQNELLVEIKATSEQLDAALVGKKPDKVLTREMVVSMIDTVIIYDEQTIEVKFNFDDIGKRVV